jgi:hypothetical protein
MMDVKKLAFSFAAGAAAVLVFHQSMVLALHLLGAIPNFPWSIRAIPPYGVPAIFNQMFWGGLWGVAFAALAHLIPIGNLFARGAVFGLIGPWLLGNGVLVPFFKNGTFLFGLNPMNMWRGALIGAAFGVGISVFMGLLGRR